MPHNSRELKKSLSELPFPELERLTEWCEDLLAKRRYQALCDDTEGIHSKDVLKVFRKSLGPVSYWRKMLPEEASTHMQMFYEETRVRGCRFEDEADMLLVEWGPATKTEYALAYTRQLMPPRPDGESDIWQLRLELRFPLTEELRKQKSGSRWFESLKKLDRFVEFTLTKPPFSRLGETIPSRVLLTYENAE
jgi:hypothetical protein